MISGNFKVLFGVLCPALFLCRFLTGAAISSLRMRKHFRDANQLLFLFGIVLGLVGLSPAQVDRAGLSGTVADPSGRVLPQTHITAVHNATGLRRETTSSSSGTYDIAELPIGVYTVTFTHNGFKSLTFENVVQTVGQTRTLNATLPISGGEEQGRGAV